MASLIRNAMENITDDAIKSLLRASAVNAPFHINFKTGFLSVPGASVEAAMNKIFVEISWRARACSSI
ncbi:hypothetical protein O9929_07800 [Vibrio lentus]|nr:hypothetical protein [Vibrio lentus]